MVGCLLQEWYLRASQRWWYLCHIALDAQTRIVATRTFTSHRWTVHQTIRGQVLILIATIHGIVQTIGSIVQCWLKYCTTGNDCYFCCPLSSAIIYNSKYLFYSTLSEKNPNGKMIPTQIYMYKY